MFRRFYLLILAALLLSACSSLEPLETTATSQRFQVTIENLTTGQAFTPPLIATHRPSTALFQVGQTASLGIKEIAENGNLAPMLEALANNKHVSDVMVAIAGDPPPLFPGQTVSVEISSSLGAKYISFASMLICTNDGFTGLNTLRLPQTVGATVTAYTDAYDAGTEINTEDFADIVPPCPVLSGVATDKPGTGMSNPELAEGGVIHHHSGIQGGSDLDPSIHGWADPVAKVTITRLD